jgi:photosystem II stability/assembly factor-like uncharacterized protein
VLFGSDSANAHTVSGIGPGAGTAVTVCTFDPSNADVMYMGGDCQGVMRSLDGGQSWSAPNTGLINAADPFYEAYFVLDIEVDPTDTNNVYTGTMRGIYKSSDKALTWTKLDFSQATGDLGLGTHTPIGVIEVDPADGNVIYAGFGDLYFHDSETAKGILLKSTDGGSSWSRIGQNTIASDSIIYGIALDPDGTASARRLVVSTDKGVYNSEDGGSTFSQFETGLPHNKGRRIAVSRSSGGQTVFYLVLFPKGLLPGGVYKWSVGTDSWDDANGTGGDEPLVLRDKGSCVYNWIDVDPSKPDIVHLASAASYVEKAQCDTETQFRSKDGGATWEELWPEPTSGWYKEVSIFPMLAVAPSNPDVLLGGYITMIKSTDGGDTWSQIYTDIKETGSSRSYKSRSNDIGSQMWALSMAIDPRPEKADTMYQGYADALLFKTEDMAYFRRLSPTPVPDPITDLAEGWGTDGDGNLTPQVTLDPDDPDIVYASANFHLYKSTDGGESWVELTGWSNPSADIEGKRENAARFAIDPGSLAAGRTIYVTVYGEGVFKTTDGGQNWTDLSGKIGSDAKALSGVYLDPSDSKRIYLGSFSLMHYSDQEIETTYPIYYSGDGGDTWETRGDLPAVNRIWIDPQDGQRVLAVTMDYRINNNPGGIYLSTDGGKNWNRVLTQPFVTDIAYDPHTVDRMWALSAAYYQPDTGLDTPGVNAGLYQSLDRGSSWDRVNMELNHYSLYPLGVHPTRANELYIGTAGMGIKKINLSADGDTTTTITGTTTTTSTEGVCSIEETYGEQSKETELLRYFRDNVLSKSPEGQEIIRRYYQWSPLIADAMEGDEKFRKEIKETIDGILALIK